MSAVDEAVVWGKRSVDPWHRMTCCPEAVFAVIEFCQVVFLTISLFMDFIKIASSVSTVGPIFFTHGINIF